MFSVCMVFFISGEREQGMVKTNVNTPSEPDKVTIYFTLPKGIGIVYAIEWACNFAAIYSIEYFLKNRDGILLSVSGYCSTSVLLLPGRLNCCLNAFSCSKSCC